MKAQQIYPFFLTILLLLASQIHAQSEDEKAIGTVAMDYLVGWYSADTAKMARALSPELAKRGFILNRTNQLIIAEATYAQMLEWTGKKPNELKKDPPPEFEVYVLEIGENIAMVKTVAPDFIDYLHLGKIDGKWKIYNAIWERPNAQ
jgi:hypothetical protein